MSLEFCPDCGSKVPPEGKFCVSCGQALRTSEESDSQTGVASDYQAKMEKGVGRSLPAELRLPVPQEVAEVVTQVQAGGSQARTTAFNLRLWPQRAAQLLALLLLAFGGVQCLPELLDKGESDLLRRSQAMEPAQIEPPKPPSPQQAAPSTPLEPIEARESESPPVPVPEPPKDQRPQTTAGSNLEKAHARYLGAYEHYTAIVSGQKSGDVKAAQAEYREAYRAYAELRNQTR